MNTGNSLNRFLEAQENIYHQALQELRSGKKVSHWMWFIFPQVDGLGQSSTAKYYSIKSIGEAKEYVTHPVLGKRLLECANILVNLGGKSASAIFGYPDELKLRSSMTLFDQVAPEQKVFAEVLKKYFNGKVDEKTISLLSGMQG